MNTFSTLITLVRYRRAKRLCDENKDDHFIYKQNTYII